MIKYSKDFLLKKWWFWGVFAVLIFLLLIFPRGSEGDSLSTSNNSAKIYKMNDEMQVGNLKFQVIDIANRKEIKIDDVSKKAEQNFLIIKLSIENAGKQPQKVKESFFELISKSGKVYKLDKDISSFVNESDSFFNRNLDPHSSLIGYLIFDVPTETDKIQFTLQLTDDELMGNKASVGIEGK